RIVAWWNSLQRNAVTRRSPVSVPGSGPPMRHEIRCPKCSKPLHLADSALGREVKCPWCGWKFTAVPGIDEPEVGLVPIEEESPAATRESPSTEPPEEQFEPAAPEPMSPPAAP